MYIFIVVILVLVLQRLRLKYYENENEPKRNLSFVDSAKLTLNNEYCSLLTARKRILISPCDG